jgi:serine kinase of HPr protein (carbohydrate metabolism regulator)
MNKKLSDWQMCKNMQIHATMVVFEGQGILLKGASGSGKSDLALRLIANKGASLVADDIVNLYEKNGEIFGTAPENLQGLLEVRGVGIVKYPFVNEAKLELVVNLVAPNEVERMPKNEYENILRVEIPKIDLYARENSAPEKILTKLFGCIVNDISI